MSLETVQECFRMLTKESYVTGYTNIFNLLTMRSPCYTNNINSIISIFEKECYAKAKKYNNIHIVDKIKYDNDVNMMIHICEYITRYYLTIHNKPNLLNDIINNSWNKAEKVKNLSMIGYICVQKNLPSGDPCWIAKMIGSNIV